MGIITACPSAFIGLNGLNFVPRGTYCSHLRGQKVVHKIGSKRVADVVCRGETCGSAEVGSPLGLYLSPNNVLRIHPHRFHYLSAVTGSDNKAEFYSNKELD